MAELLAAQTDEHTIEDMLALNPDPFLTVDQAARYLNVKPSFIRDIAKQRRIATVKIGGCLRIRKSECERVGREGQRAALATLRRSRFN